MDVIKCFIYLRNTRKTQQLPLLNEKPIYYPKYVLALHVYARLSSTIIKL